MHADPNPYAAPGAEDAGDWHVITNGTLIRRYLLLLLGIVAVIALVFPEGIFKAPGWSLLGWGAGALVSTVWMATIDLKHFAIRWDASGLTGPRFERGRRVGFATVDFGNRVTIRTFTLLCQTEISDDLGNTVTVLHAYIPRTDRQKLIADIERLYALIGG